MNESSSNRTNKLIHKIIDWLEPRLTFRKNNLKN